MQSPNTASPRNSSRSLSEHLREGFSLTKERWVKALLRRERSWKHQERFCSKSCKAASRSSVIIFYDPSNKFSILNFIRNDFNETIDQRNITVRHHNGNIIMGITLHPAGIGILSRFEQHAQFLPQKPPGKCPPFCSAQMPDYTCTFFLIAFRHPAGQRGGGRTRARRIRKDVKIGHRQ